MTAAATTEKVDDRYLVTTRVIDAPRDLVFQAWTDPRALNEWFGPDGFTTTTKTFDMRPGGSWVFVMHGPDGTDYPNRILYDEIVRPELIRFRHDGGDGDPGVQFKNTVTFEELGGKTLIVMRAEFPSKEALDHVIREYHADEGGRQTIGRLAAFAEGKAKRPYGSTWGKTRPIKTAVIVRTFDAPRDLVWAAWTDPQHLAAWWGPHSFTAPVCEVDLRPGGRLRIDMQPPGGGPANSVIGAFDEVIPPERLSFSSEAFWDENGVAALQGFNIVTLIERDGRTTLTLEAQILKAADWLAAGIAGMEEGWGQSLDKLRDLLVRLRR